MKNIPKKPIDIKHPGALHAYLGLPSNTEIPEYKVRRLLDHPDEHVRQMAQFALNSRKFKH